LHALLLQLRLTPKSFLSFSEGKLLSE
jgi:hypothetical protein